LVPEVNVACFNTDFRTGRKIGHGFNSQSARLLVLRIDLRPQTLSLDAPNLPSSCISIHASPRPPNNHGGYGSILHLPERTGTDSGIAAMRSCF
jgi:hypothetical protein